ncbi:MAG: cysteine--tRNA ligase [Candidatus Lloydbacteria bacterium RIFCSPLOWO2_02_FULL_51_11]|uniref:Cysteine--tRNA ligase n=1 Tax=Candidatus Lloydbacteria bacterium RIFCSPLOWO2_02_FULL_51_11 TaxID=1798667 RepID=A0A1G2DNT8_9BACT|nr:MAG: cysteine--tRNA ligase [Candidatus Lloydbacteria bacterium RIFCSPLOWO2_02_FULL_51_11]
MLLYNTLTRKKEEFSPIQKGRVSMYHCGPTVYDYAHIGNFRSYVFADILRRTFEHTGFSVKQAMNITDVGHLTSDADEGEDKMALALKRAHKTLTVENMRELADFYTARFKEDLKKLNILTPHEMPRASEHIPAQIALIKRLEEKGLTYKITDGIYFDTEAYPEYGKLSGAMGEPHDHSRIGANKEKKNHRDFALWKLNPALGWESPWGKGFPGWHIECSAMAMEALGESFDIHTGGIDHIGTHHTNEMAQSEAATGKEFVHYWLHNEFVSVDGAKMSKSKSNLITLKDLAEKGFDPLAYRYWLLTAHYRTPVNFTWEALTGAEVAMKKIQGIVSRFSNVGELGTQNKDYVDAFTAFIEDDLDTPKAVALIHKMIGDDSVDYLDKKATLSEMNQILGIEDNAPHEYITDETVIALTEERRQAREQKDWKRADGLRDEIKKHGYDIKDTPTGQALYPLRT